jgi:activator of HSP90 ATPase
MTSRVLVSLRVAATPERAFGVFVNDIGAWWRPNDLFRFTTRSPGLLAFEPKLGGRFTETFDKGEIFEIGRITVWEPSTRVAFTWRQASFATEQVTGVEVRFDPVGDETRVTVEHLGWDTVPQDHVARHGFPDAVFLRRHAEWWKSLLAAMAGSMSMTHR